MISGPTICDLTEPQNLAAVGVAVILWLAILVFTIMAVLKSASLDPPVTLVIALTIVTLVAISAFVISGDQELATLAGLGLGALSGAVAATWQQKGQNEKKKEDRDDE